MPPISPCPNCKSMKWKPEMDLFGLLRIHKDKEGIVVDSSKVYPLRVWICQNCGYVTLYREEPR